MAIFDTNLDYTRLIQFTDGTLQLGSFVQIRNALIQRMKDIYGNDIDVSPASADGQYINSLALLINNMFQTIKKGNDSLDPAVATGQYLDTLCSFNNISRITASASSVQLYVYNPSAQDKEFDKLMFLDKNNTLWVWDNGGKKLKFLHNAYTTINDVVCEELGEVSAPGADTFYKKVTDPTDPDYDPNDPWVSVGNHPELATWTDPSLFGNNSKNGTIYQTVDQSGLYIWQYSDADVGNREETDEELRSRRYQMLGNNSVTVLEGLKGNLLNLDGIKDLFIYNNNISDDTKLTVGVNEPIADGTTIASHSIYLAIRYIAGIPYDDPAMKENIAKVIYDKLTPGIGTQATDSSTSGGDGVTYTMIRTGGFTEDISWKVCSYIQPTIVLSFYATQDYNYPSTYTAHTATSETEKNIVKKLQSFINDAKIDEYLNISQLLTTMQKADVTKNGISTFLAQSGYFGSDTTATKYPANLAYFKYDDANYSFAYEVDGVTGKPTGVATLTISVG